PIFIVKIKPAAIARKMVGKRSAICRKYCYTFVMKAYGEFLRAESIEKPKEAAEYEKAEIEAEMSSFPPDVQPILQKFLKNESLSAQEAGALKVAREAWWQEKYGFPHSRKAER